MAKTRDEVENAGEPREWKFDAEVADAFDDMLERSIPDYESMRETVFAIGSRFVRPQTTILDLGCSRGEALAPFVRTHGAHNRYVGVDVSEPMLAAARERFAPYDEVTGWDGRPMVRIESMDLRTSYPNEQASLTLAVLVFCFVPLEHRMQLARRAFRNTAPGGALIVVDKVLGSTADIDDALVETHHDLKRAAGYTDEQVARKRAALEGVLVPVTASMNEELIRAAGFADVDVIWRRLNFAAWVAVRAHV